MHVGDFKGVYSLKLFAGLLAFSVTVVAIIPAIVVFSIHRYADAAVIFSRGE